MKRATKQKQTPATLSFAVPVPRPIRIPAVELLADDSPCRCRPLAPGLYSVTPGCPRHDAEGLGCSHFQCTSSYSVVIDGKAVHPPIGCPACAENARRGKPAPCLGGAR
jgi:hypothetical protein